MVSRRNAAPQLVMALFLTSAALVGCDASDGNGDDPEGGPDGAEIEDGWSISYSGPLSGEISGSVTVQGSIELSDRSTSIAGDSFGSDARMDATYSTPTDGPHTGQVFLLRFTMTLDDGTFCSQTVTATEGSFYANVLNDDDELYRLEFSGEVDCDGTLLDVTGDFTNVH